MLKAPKAPMTGISPKKIMAFDPVRSFSSDYLAQEDGGSDFMYGSVTPLLPAYGLNGTDASIEIMDLDGVNFERHTSPELISMETDYGGGQQQQQHNYNQAGEHSNSLFTQQELWQLNELPELAPAKPKSTHSPKQPSSPAPTATSGKKVSTSQVSSRTSQPSSSTVTTLTSPLELPYGILSLLGELEESEFPSLNLDFEGRFSNVTPWLSSKCRAGGSKALESSLILSHNSDGFEYPKETDCTGEYMSMMTGSFFERLRSTFFHKNHKSSGGFDAFLEANGIGGVPNEIYPGILQNLVKKNSPTCDKNSSVISTVIAMIRKSVPETNPFHKLHETHIENYTKRGFVYYVCNHALRLVLMDHTVSPQEKQEMSEAFDTFTKSLNFALESSNGLKTSKKRTKSNYNSTSAAMTPAQTSSPSPEELGFMDFADDDQQGVPQTPSSSFTNPGSQQGVIEVAEGQVSVYNIKGRRRDETFCKCSSAHHGLISYNSLGPKVETFRIAVNLMFSRYQGLDFHGKTSKDYRLVFRHLMIDMFCNFDTAPLRTSPDRDINRVSEELMEPAMEFHELIPTFDDSLLLVENVTRHYKHRTLTVHYVLETAKNLLRALTPGSNGTTPMTPSVPQTPGRSASTKSPSSAKRSNAALASTPAPQSPAVSAKVATKPRSRSEPLEKRTLQQKSLTMPPPKFRKIQTE